VTARGHEVIAVAAVRAAGAPSLGDRILKVDHAGEHGAVNIYSAQILVARWTAPAFVAELTHFRDHELGHRARFAAELARRGRRRCRSYALCGLGGYVLGFVTGLCGAGAIAATTVAVERVVLRHLEHQMATLASTDPEAVAAIAAIVAEEREHHDRSALHLRAGRRWTRLLMPLVEASTEAVIWSGMRL
jgi:3-demethoxyubiquinol 3-hydroxylase